MTRLFSPGADYRQAWSGTVLVLAPGEIPTVDFYITPRLRHLAPEQILRFDSRSFNGQACVIPGDAFVVIVRHAARRWLDYLARQRERLSGVAFLMDDDIPAAWRCRDVPWDYGVWTSARYGWTARLLGRVCDRVWFSTATLRARYAEVPGCVVPPLAFAEPREPAPMGCRRWGYHGTRIHYQEVRWLVPIVARVQEKVAEAVFEIFGDRRVEKLFAGIPRVEVLPPRSWSDYVTHARRSSMAVGLAPLLPGRFNAARSHTKLYDMALCGAVGVFSARAPYWPGLAEAGVPCLPDEPEVWVREITTLLADDGRRLERYGQQCAWIDRHGQQGCIQDLIGQV